MRYWFKGVWMLGAVTAIIVVVGGCGGAEDAASTPSSPTPATDGTSSDGTSTDGPTTTNPSATALPGPRLPSATSVPPSRQDPSISGTRCGTAPGPEGALRVVVLAGTADCAVVTPVARDYGPKISTGREQRVGGWTCGPSQTAGILARCTRGADTFGLVPQ